MTPQHHCQNLTPKIRERKFPSRSPFATKWRHHNHPHPTRLSANRGLVDSTSRCLGIPRQPSRGAQLATEGVASEMANMTSLTPAGLQKWYILRPRITLSVCSAQSSTRILEPGNSRENQLDLFSLDHLKWFSISRFLSRNTRLKRNSGSCLEVWDWEKKFSFSSRKTRVPFELYYFSKNLEIKSPFLWKILNISPSNKTESREFLQELSSSQSSFWSRKLKIMNLDLVSMPEIEGNFSLSHLEA